jgi:two-component system, OmpR family, sensor histidine kinase KdpD
MTRRSAPFAIALAGAIVITGVIGVAGVIGPTAGLSALYLLFVLWLGASWGRGPAIAASIAAFLLYDFFFVPPAGTFAVRGPAELLELVVLLAVALVTSQLAASLRRAQATSDAIAADSRALYELSTSMLRTEDVNAGLAMVCASAAGLPGLERIAITGSDLIRLAGAELDADDVIQARWAYENGRPVGIAVKGGAVVPMKTHGASDEASYFPLRGGVVVLEIDARSMRPSDLRMLAALIGLADLLLERRRASAESERARGLEASDSLKAAILSSLSHELKSPIATLRAGLTALTSERAGLPAEQRELLSDMDHQATRLDAMVGELLTLSRLEAGLELELEPHSLADIMGVTLGQLKARLNGHEVAIDLPEDLPPVDVDELQVERVVFNLVENALEWAPADGSIRIGACHLDPEHKVEVWVENDGPDIAPPDLDRIFDTFWTGRTGGTGLGLAISKRVVEAHGGRIRAQNRRGGPRFTFTVPVAAVRASG